MFADKNRKSGIQNLFRSLSLA